MESDRTALYPVPDCSAFGTYSKGIGHVPFGERTLIADYRSEDKSRVARESTLLFPKPACLR